MSLALPNPLLAQGECLDWSPGWMPGLNESVCKPFKRIPGSPSGQNLHWFSQPVLVGGLLFLELVVWAGLRCVKFGTLDPQRIRLHLRCPSWLSSATCGGSALFEPLPLLLVLKWLHLYICTLKKFTLTLFSRLIVLEFICNFDVASTYSIILIGIVGVNLTMQAKYLCSENCNMYHAHGLEVLISLKYLYYYREPLLDMCKCSSAPTWKINWGGDELAHRTIPVKKFFVICSC